MMITISCEGSPKVIATRLRYGQCRLGGHLAEGPGRGWGLDKNNKVGIVVVGLTGNWGAEVIQKSISLSSQVQQYWGPGSGVDTVI